jgi:hypothetical protein
MSTPLEFSVHGRAGIHVEAGVPGGSQLEEMFAAFLVDRVHRRDLVVVADHGELVEESFGEHDYAYTDDAVRIAAMNVEVRRLDNGFRISGRRELLTTVLPLLDRVMVCTDAAMIHAATVRYRGRGICMPAWGGVGKTSTVAKLMRLDDVAFMGDDWAFVSGGGTLLGYAKPMFIKPHHRTIYPHLFAAKRKPLVPSRLSRPLANFTTLVHPVVTAYPRLSKISRRWSPEYLTVTPAEAFPGTPIATEAPLDIVVFVERYAGSVTRLDSMSRAWMVSRMLGNFHAEMSAHSRDVLTALATTGVLPMETFVGDKVAVLERALAGVPTYRLRVPVLMSADEASDTIVDSLHKALADAGLG